ncbi:MAG: M50 family metallopeptidase [Elusimicrobia bacterium]|nr:M50 family metallopeptidase [Elusimicrobiota bacterium]
MTSRDRPISFGRLALLALLVALAWFAWDTVFLYPVRILVTFIHEFSHGIGAVLTGGNIGKITVEADGSGLCWTCGGWRLVVLPAGYIGSMVGGCLLLILACRTRWDKYISLFLGLGLMAATLLYVRSMFGFGYGLAMGAVLASAGWWLPEDANDFLLSFIGVTSCLYAVFDIRTLMRIGGSANNDALMFSKIIPLPAAVWAALWGILAVVVLGFGLMVALKKSRD